MTVSEKIKKYIATRSTPATAKEIAKFAKVNYNSARRVIGDMLFNHELLAFYNVKCKVDKAPRQAYTLN
jgi:hypothetical protein